MGPANMLVGGRRGLSCQLHQLLFPAFFEKIHIEVAVCLDPIFMRFNGQGADKSEATLLVREYPHHAGPPFDFFVKPFQHVGGFEMFVVSSWQAIE